MTVVVGLGVDLVRHSRIHALCLRRGADRLAARICAADERRAFDAIRAESADALLSAQSRWLATRYAMGGFTTGARGNATLT